MIYARITISLHCSATATTFHCLIQLQLTRHPLQQVLGAKYGENGLRAGGNLEEGGRGGRRQVDGSPPPFPPSVLTILSAC